jgi:hypothetical protein
MRWVEYDRGLLDRANTVERSRQARATACQRCEDAIAIAGRVRQTQAEALDVTTTAADRYGDRNPIIAARLGRLSQVMGRSPLIE